MAIAVAAANAFLYNNSEAPMKFVGAAKVHPMWRPIGWHRTSGDSIDTSTWYQDWLDTPVFDLRDLQVRGPNMFKRAFNAKTMAIAVGDFTDIQPRGALTYTKPTGAQRGARG